MRYRRTKPLVDRFWAKVEKTEACWKWHGSKSPGGYGQIREGGRGSALLRAPRYSWAIHIGPIPEGLCVCHKCDNPECTRPDHLFLGTLGDNMRDCYAKGRKQAVRKLDMEQVTARPITVNGETHSIREWARRTGVKVGTIWWRLEHGKSDAEAVAPGDRRRKQ